MAAGLPVVANPVGMNRQLVVDGRTGLWAETPAEWAAAIRRLAFDPQLRQRMGAAGRRVIQRKYGVQRWGPELAEAIATAAVRAGAPRVARFGGREDIPGSRGRLVELRLPPRRRGDSLGNHRPKAERQRFPKTLLEREP
jgi:hypothetical protein